MTPQWFIPLIQFAERNVGHARTAFLPPAQDTFRLHITPTPNLLESLMIWHRNLSVLNVYIVHCLQLFFFGGFTFFVSWQVFAMHHWFEHSDSARMFPMLRRYVEVFCERIAPSSRFWPEMLSGLRTSRRLATCCRIIWCDQHIRDWNFHYPRVLWVTCCAFKSCVWIQCYSTGSVFMFCIALVWRVFWKYPVWTGIYLMSQRAPFSLSIAVKFAWFAL